jgi:hypothetical protein
VEFDFNALTIEYIANVFFPQLVYAFEPLYITTAGIIKISVLLMYHRIFPVRYVRIGGLILAAITLAWVISIDLLAIFQCTPIAKAYNPTLPGHCISLKGALIGNGVPNFVVDIFILALPSKLIWGLQASIWQRVSVIAVFLTGSLYVLSKRQHLLQLPARRGFFSETPTNNIHSVIFASIYRFTLIFSFDITDVAWTLADAQTWCVVELAAGVISACLPTTAPLVKICTRGLVSTAKSLTKSNLTQSEGKVLSRTDATTRSMNGGSNITIKTDLVHAHRASNASFALEDMSPRGSSHLKGKGWTMISADRDSDSA